ncbi:hypothetical protein INQ32_25980, partial [Escherichia coli]|nr:hypothetical protein [Escherichia coli]
EAPFDEIQIWPIAQAAVFNIAAQAFATIADMPVPRAMHSATLLPDARVLLAGGALDWKMQASDTSVMFDPTSFAFSGGPTLQAARRSQGAVLV